MWTVEAFEPPPGTRQRQTTIEDSLPLMSHELNLFKVHFNKQVPNDPVRSREMRETKC